MILNTEIREQKTEDKGQTVFCTLSSDLSSLFTNPRNLDHRDMFDICGTGH